jgi:hypothetical protein
MKWIWYIAAAMLLLGVVSMPPGYYPFLRIIVFVSAIIAMYTNYELKESGWLLVFGVVALIFNPIAPLYLYDKTIWAAIDLVCGIAFIINSKKID